MASSQVTSGNVSKATLTLDDIDNIDRQNYIHTIGTVAVADRKYDSEKTTFRRIIDKVQDDNPDVISVQEKVELVKEIPSLRNALRDDDHTRGKEILTEFKPIFLKIKKERVRERRPGRKGKVQM